MQENFAKSLTRILVYEGGYSNNPNDPGRATMRGITQAVYTSWRRNHGQGAADVRGITDAEVAEIYRKQYWDAVQGDVLPPGVDLVVFDGAVNSGPKQSIKWLQRALDLAADGVIGQMTLDAVKSDMDNDALIGRIIKRRLAFQQALTIWKDFGNGWAVRDANVKAAGQAWASGSVGPNVTTAEGASAKADISDAKAVVSGPIAHLGAGIGIATATVPQITDALAPASVVPLFSKIATIITVIGVGVTVAGIAYAGYVSRQKTALADALDTVAA